MFLVAIQELGAERYLARGTDGLLEWDTERERALRVAREEAENLVDQHGGYLLEIVT